MRNTIIRLISLAAVMSSSAVMAVAEGPYLGIDIGLGNTNVKQSGSKSSTGDTSIAGGATWGSQFNRFGAVELGVTHWANGSSDAAVTCGSTVIHNNSLNVLGKGIIPIAGFNIFGKAGVGVLRSSGGGVCGSSNTKTTTSAKPMVGGGISYDLSQTTVIDLTYSRLFANTSQVSNLNLLTLGISYHFVDVYCGQFLA